MKTLGRLIGEIPFSVNRLFIFQTWLPAFTWMVSWRRPYFFRIFDGLPEMRAGTIIMNTRTEELYLEAEADIRNSNFHEAFRKYEEILYEEPDYAPAHNSLGWIYKTQFENFHKAEIHFKAAIAADALYPHPYFHLASILVDLERYEELKEFLDRCLGIRTVDKSWVYFRHGMINELRGQYNDAMQWYRKALLQSMNNDKVKEYQADIERCMTKLNITKQKEPWYRIFGKK